MTSDLLRQGVELMLVGMGTVFAFLTLLVLATLLMSRLVLRWQPEDETGATTPGSEAEEVAAIAAAVALHRRHR